ncbi:MAG TPA: dTMP kinase [Candidatus Bathyarchaeia archaeon]|nr:dTMP kinase [Candidatus Bathyarchaeia archaeon]
MNKTGIFIVVEGLDGSGKTTQAKVLASRLRRNHKALYTAEPSRGKVGIFIRNRILYGEKRPSTIVEALLFAADRVEHVQNEVQPALEEGQIVVSDRYLYSSLAYQGSAGLSIQWIESINQHALKPDLALFIDVDPEEVFHRLKRRKSVMENLETQRRVREIYLKFVEKGDLVRIDGDQTKSQVADEIYAIANNFLKTRV